MTGVVERLVSDGLHNGADMTAVRGVEAYSSYIVLASNKKKNQKTKLLEDNKNYINILRDYLNHTQTHTRVVTDNY